jgi:hypothetical protein
MNSMTVAVLASPSPCRRAPALANLRKGIEDLDVLRDTDRVAVGFQDVDNEVFGDGVHSLRSVNRRF